jgi:hypothetical protein
MVKTLAGYLSSSKIDVLHARDLGLHAKPDVEWMKYLSRSGDDWLIFTGDGRIRKNRAEREAYRRANLKGVVLAPAYQKTPMGRCCGIIVAKWDSLLDFTNRIEAPYLVELSINLSPKYKILPI